MADLNLPALVALNDFGGDWDVYYDFIYKCFRDDFIINPLANFKGKRMGLKRLPIIDDKEATFYHLTHEGNDEQNRTPCLRRMERIKWVKHMMCICDHEDLRMWRNKRGSNENILIYCEAEEYIVVLADRGEYILPWTAYKVTYNHTKRTLLKEYEAYKKAEAAKQA